MIVTPQNATFAPVVMEPALADFAMAAVFIECMDKAVHAAVLTENAANAAAQVISYISLKDCLLTVFLNICLLPISASQDIINIDKISSNA